MPAIAEEPAPRLTLANFDGPGTPADDYVMPPSKGGEAAPPAAPDAAKGGKIDEPPIAPLAAEDDDPPPPDKKIDEPEPDTRSLSDTFEDPAEIAAREAKEKADADKKAADEKTSADKAKADGTPPPTPERDSDLKVDTGAHTHPKTRKVITEFQAKAKAARDERDAVIAEREAMKKERDALAEKGKNVAVPEATAQELKTLRERVRELDIAQDPVIQQKYDAKMEANNKSILSVLKSQGFGKTKKEGSDEYVDNPAAVSALVKSGLTLKNLQPYIKALEDGDFIDEAEAVRDAVRENNRLARDRQQEIDLWKGDFDRRKQEREVVTKQQQETQTQAFRQQTDTQLKADLAELEKSFPHLKQPAGALPTDTPATQKAKQAAIDEWTAASKAVEGAVKGFSPDGVPPEKMAELVGRINASAIQAQVIRIHVLPKLQKEMAALTERNKELEAELGKIRDAGKLSRQHSSASGDTRFSGAPAPKTLEEAFGNAPTL